MKKVDFSTNNFTLLDNLLYDKLTTKKKVMSGQKSRNAYICNIDISAKCDTHVFYKGLVELQRIFNHFKRDHQVLLNNFLIKFLIDNAQTNIEQYSSSPLITIYIKQHIYPIYESERKKKEINIDNNSISKNQEHCLDLNAVDLTKLNQVILQNGIYERLPLSKISSKPHLSFIQGFFKLGFELGRNSNISVNDFLRICNGVKIPRNLLNSLGNDYFQASISYFKGSLASFEIDAGTINYRQILLFVLFAKNRYQNSILFDFEDEFKGDLISYQKVVRSKILKAKENNISIVGITSDNLPVQIQAVCHESPDSIQNIYDDVKNIVHFRCSNHLLNLAYKDWIMRNNKLSDYENKTHKILNVLNKKIFSKKLTKKIPKINITRWNSAFKALEMIFRLRTDIINLFKNPKKTMIKDLLKIKEDVKFIFSVGFLEVYPLLFHFASLMDYLQSENVSCVESIVIIEFFLNKIKNNIIEYEISESGKELYDLIKKRLILNKNIQLYNLASLMTPDGIVRYRKIMKSNPAFNITEDESTYFHCISDSIIISINQENRMISVKNYQNLEYDNFMSVLDKFTPIQRKRKSAISQVQNQSSNLKQSNLHQFYSKKASIEKEQQGNSVLNEENANMSDDDSYDEISISSSSSDDSEEEEEEEDSKDIDIFENTMDKDFVTLNELDINFSNSDIINIQHNEIIPKTDIITPQSDETTSVSHPETSDIQANSSQESPISTSESDVDEKSSKNYSNRKSALKWKNITDLLIKNTQYLDLTEDEAGIAAIELYDLLTMPFSFINESCPSSITSNSKYTHFWSTIKDFEYEVGRSFNTIYKVAMRLYAIAASEAGAERSFSTLGWRFDKRRNKTKQKTMFNEIHIENAQKMKLKSNKDMSTTMWNLPKHA